MTTEFIPDMMQTIRRGESMICTDPKGELRSKTYKMAKKHNYIVRGLTRTEEEIMRVVWNSENETCIMV